MKKLILGLALAAIATPAFAAKPDPKEWFEFMTQEDGTVLYVHIDDFRATPANMRDARVWILAAAPKNSGDNWTQQRGLQSINCVDRSYHLLQLTTYYANGDVKTDARPAPVNYLVPDSFLDSVADVLCMAK